MDDIKMPAFKFMEILENIHISGQLTCYFNYCDDSFQLL